MKQKITEESDELKLINYSFHKTGHLYFEKLFQDWLKKLPHELLINELKRRKIVKFDWEENKFKRKNDEK
jgi:hypothetical protein